MIKNFNVPLLDAFGKQCEEGGKKLTLADVAVQALTAHCPGDENLTPTDKINLMSLAIRIAEVADKENGEREFSKEELVRMKDRAGRNVQILAFARLLEIIDSDEKKPDVPAPVVPSVPG